MFNKLRNDSIITILFFNIIFISNRAQVNQVARNINRPFLYSAFKEATIYCGSISPY